MELKTTIQKSKLFKTFKFLLALLTFNFSLLTFPTPTFAACEPGKPIGIGDCFGFGSIHSLGEATSKLVNPAFELAAALVVLLLLFGTFKYLTSEGNKEAVDEARKMMTNAFIGFLILMFSFLALKYLLYALFGITSPGFELINSQ